MTMYNGRLWKTLPNYLEQYGNGSTFALLVIDERGGQRKQKDLQLHTMMLSVNMAKKYKFRIIFVELLKREQQDVITNGKLAKAIDVEYDIFYKTTFNAFAQGMSKDGKSGESELHTYLQGLGIRELVIMGQQGGQCVKLTAIGGKEGSLKSKGDPIDGAVGYGYRVWTTPRIVQSNDDNLADLKWMSDTEEILAFSML